VCSLYYIDLPFSFTWRGQLPFFPLALLACLISFFFKFDLI
jgi:hypothetical protein